MATLSPQFFELLEADQKEIFFDHLDEIAELFPQLFEQVSSTKAYEDRMRVAGLGTLVTKPEGTPIAFDDPVQGTRRRTVHTTYGLGWRATMEMMEDDQFGIMDRMSAELGRSTRDHRDRLAWSLIDDGFSGSTYTGLDGLALFTSHTSIKTGTSQSNALSPAVELGVTGLESVMTLARTTLSEEDRYIDLKHAVVVGHPNLMHTANVLLKTQYEVDTSNNNISTVVQSESGLTFLGVPYLTSTTAWSVHAPPGQNGLKWYNRKDVTTDTALDPDTRDMKHYVLYRASVAFDEYRGNWGSNFS